MADSSVRILRAADRFQTVRETTITTHEFSFGDHYDPGRISFGVLVAHNIETLTAGGGYAPHRHQDLEIVTWVLSGVLEHSDDHGHVAQLEAGSVQRLTAADGVTHSEVSGVSADGPTTRFVQLWLRCLPDELPPGAAPSYQHGAVQPGRLHGRWVALASSDAAASPQVRLHVPGVTLWAVDLDAGDTIAVPVGALLHLYAVSGVVVIDRGETLDAGDSARLRHAGPVGIQAREDTRLLALAMPE